MGRRWLLAILAVLTVLVGAGCTAGGPSGTPQDPRDLLRAGTDAMMQAGSARFTGTSTAFASSGTPVTYDGTLTWSDGTTGEIHTQSAPGGAPTTVLITKDALYGEVPPQLAGTSGAVPGLAGKKWIKQTNADLTALLGPLGDVFRAALDQTNPIRSSALLVQSGDLRVVGQEPRNGVDATHYTGTIRFDQLVADLKLGLSDQVLTELRNEARAQGTDSEQLDLWLDGRGFPVRAEARTTDATRGQLVTTADYSDYGGPKPVTAPPPDQVLDFATLRGQFGIGPN